MRVLASATDRVRALVAVSGLVLLGVIFSWTSWTAPVRWTPDALFYEAQSHEVTGTDAAAARSGAFFGPLGRSITYGAERVGDQRWIDYSAPFYRRRWVAPVAAAAIRPLFGARSLLVVSLLGYILSGVGAFLLLRRRFGDMPATLAAAIVLWFPPLRNWSAYPLTDSLGVAVLFGCAFAGCRAQSGSRWRVALWVASVALLAFTRDVAMIPVFAAFAYAFTRRSRRAVFVAGSGLIAALPALLLFGAPVRTTLAFTFSNNRIPADDSWSFVLHKYGHFVGSMINNDFPVRASVVPTLAAIGIVGLLAISTATPRLARIRKHAVLGLLAVIAVDLLLYSQLQIWAQPFPAGVLLLIGLLPLLPPAASSDALMGIARAGALGATAYLFILPEYTHMRLTLILVPFAAVGLARGITWWNELAFAASTVDHVQASVRRRSDAPIAALHRPIPRTSSTRTAPNRERRRAIPR